MKRVVKNRWTLPITGALVLLVVALPGLAQRPAGRSTDAVRAKEMAQLIEQGQLNLRDAAAMAEKHVKGIALEATCDIQPGAPSPGERGQPEKPTADKPGAPTGQEQPKETKAAGGKRLLYEIDCFANDRVHTVQVDALAKKVVEKGEGTPPPKP
jgi:hypothetical protein